MWRTYLHQQSLLPGGSALLGSQARAAGRWSISLGRVDPDGGVGWGGGFLKSFSSQLSVGITGISLLSVDLIFTVSPCPVSQGARA